MSSFLNKEVESLPTPCCVVDLQQVKKNCSKIQKIARSFDCTLRPHVKTHKCPDIAIHQTGPAKTSIVVSTFAEARGFLEQGFRDVLIGLPLSVDKIPYYSSLRKTYPESDLHCLIDNFEIINHISSNDFSCYLKVNCDNGRAGVLWNSQTGVKLAKLLHGKGVLKGFYAHCGNSYGSDGDRSFILKVAKETAEKILKFKESTGLNIPVGIGSTPSCSITDVKNCEILSKIDELHPGNYVFYDVMQHSIGSCELEEIACKIMTRVISVQPENDYVIVDCGFTAISKQGIGSEKLSHNDSAGESINYVRVYGSNEVVDLKLSSVSQEHGIVRGQGIKKLKVGDLLEILPWHSCVVSSLHEFLFCHEGDGMYYASLQACSKILKKSSRFIATQTNRNTLQFDPTFPDKHVIREIFEQSADKWSNLADLKQALHISQRFTQYQLDLHQFCPKFNRLFKYSYHPNKEFDLDDFSRIQALPIAYTMLTLDERDIIFDKTIRTMTRNELKEYENIETRMSHFMLTCDPLTKISILLYCTYCYPDDIDKINLLYEKLVPWNPQKFTWLDIYFNASNVAYRQTIVSKILELLPLLRPSDPVNFKTLDEFLSFISPFNHSSWKKYMPNDRFYEPYIELWEDEEEFHRKYWEFLDEENTDSIYQCVEKYTAQLPIAEKIGEYMTPKLSYKLFTEPTEQEHLSDPEKPYQMVDSNVSTYSQMAIRLSLRKKSKN